MLSARLGACRLALIAAVVAVVTFFRVVSFDFAYDDNWTIVENASLERPLAPLLRALLSGRGTVEHIVDATRPAMVVSTWVDRHLFYLAPEGYHLHSLLLYGAVCAVATLALVALSRRRRIALVGGLFFAVAPIHAEVVSAINYREDLIAALGTLIALVWIFAPRRQPERAYWVVLAAGAWLWSLLGKESAVALVLLVVGAVAVERHGRPLWHHRRRTFIALGVALVLWGGWRAALRVLGRDDVPLTLEPRSLGDRLLSTARYSTRGVFDSVLPFFWSPEHAPELTASPWWLLPLAALVLLTVILSRRRRTRPLALGLAIALLAPLPTSPLVGPINETADRYAFLGVLGGALVWGWAANEIARRIGVVCGRRALPGLTGRRMLWAALALAVLPGWWVSQHAAVPWRNDMSLWTTAVERAPEAPRAWTGLSRALRLAGRLDEADIAVERAVRLNPRFLRARVTRTYNHLARGDIEAARREIKEIEHLGGASQRGMARARRCAGGAARDAPGCIAGAAGQSAP